jgi:hypothetical protein
MWATCPLSVSSGYQAEFHEGCYLKHTNPLHCRTSSSDISGYHTALSENGRGAAWRVLIKAARYGRGTAWARHGMCELAFTVGFIVQLDNTYWF